MHNMISDDNDDENNVIARSRNNHPLPPNKSLTCDAYYL